MKPTLGVPALIVLLFLAACDQTIGQTETAKSRARIAWSPHQVERAAIAAKNINRVLGSLLRVTSREIEGRFFYRRGTWWYWMPEGYWVMWDGENWIAYRK
jgi:hypothetical protein